MWQFENVRIGWGALGLQNSEIKALKALIQQGKEPKLPFCRILVFKNDFLSLSKIPFPPKNQFWGNGTQIEKWVVSASEMKSRQTPSSNNHPSSKFCKKMTSIVKVQPFPTTKTFANSFLDDWFNRSISDFVGFDSVVNQPAVNVVEGKDSLRVEFAAPGFDKQDFALHLENDQLTVTGKRELKTENAGENRFVRREFRYESFKRSFKLPQTVNQEAISAVYENGILNVTLPKKEEAKPTSKTIQIG
jgi:HSP20 family protein